MNFISAMDECAEEMKKGDLQWGENGHVEHGWSQTDLQEQIVQLFFQLVRTRDDAPLKKKWVALLTHIQTWEEEEEREYYVTIVVKMLCHTRDVVSGKGEYALAYMMLLTLYDFFPERALQVLVKFVQMDKCNNHPDGNSTCTSNNHPDGKFASNNHPYGSWKDLKYLATLCKDRHTEHHEIVRTCIGLINTQLIRDVVCEDDAKLSLCAKWVPREGSKKHGWLFKRLAKDFYQEMTFMKTAKYSASYEKAHKKCYMKYRQMLADLNRRLDTVQIKQCGNTWADIDHHKTTSITLSRNKRAFLNVTKTGERRSPEEDRILCADHFKAYIDTQLQAGKHLKGKNVGLPEFTKQALALIRGDSASVEEEVLNSQWRSNATQNGGLGNMVAMVDVSSSMEGDPMHVAIALGIRVAEKSRLGKRVLTFSSRPTWHHLESQPDFVSMVRSLRSADWGMNTNFYAALQMILRALVDHAVPPAEVEDLVLAVFSDMQIDAADPLMRDGRSQPMMRQITQQYEAAGYTCPHILFWNLRSTTGFPTLSTQQGASMMSGFSPVLLNLFCEKGMEALTEATPWSMLLEMLDDPRYTI